MQRPSYNPSNYYLTSDGVISKIDSYWDKLSDNIEELENISEHTFRRLARIFAGCVMGTLPVFWLTPHKMVGLLILVSVMVVSIILSGVQVVLLWEFQSLKKRGVMLHEALKIETQNEYFEEQDVPLDERVLLKHFEIAARFPIHPFLYLVILSGLVGLNTLFLWAYYLHW
jgi:hypothetical protein